MNQTQQQLKFRKCQNIGCDVMITFRRKTDGSNGWLALERDSLGQTVTHHCKGQRADKQQQQQPNGNNDAILRQILERLETIEGMLATR